ncbi:hypothetical protein EDEG_00712 [Edhazardia aedis USNM 41457]|uniref:T-complex protein 1, zeta subunit n=1 Tax=Edhazardia aedis (strain USNM 41457) TaxID=1003232 RepID=J9DVD3_EDHAE|nr:hypothetical protein EDEG_00712 [Edhazardia aedis USNM 41457]|eukprot:EJW05247.1 hypothetical protein EDEG_00712 [Edhazardia aedis USNM 41457]
MNFISKETQITQAGQAIKINAHASNALCQLFSSNIGPYGTLKMLISPSNSVSLTKDGTIICNDVQFTHPLSKLIANSASSLSKVVGDGISTYICLICEIFQSACYYHNNGADIRRICDGIQIALCDLLKFLSTIKVKIDNVFDSDSVFESISRENEPKQDSFKDDIDKLDEKLDSKFSKNFPITNEKNNFSESRKEYILNNLSSDECAIYRLILASLSTKIDRYISKKMTSYVFEALKSITKNENFDTNMIEIMRFGDGDPEDSIFVDGIVFDHGNRHPMMPTNVDNCAIMIGNISLEYEKPEINVQFQYASAEQRDALVASERKFIFERAVAIAEFAKKVKETTGKNFVLINEKGIDPISLEVLANANVLALRRSKRRNLERLIKCCGGSIISRVDQLDFDSLGSCESINVQTFNDEKFTFLQGTPIKGSCTILIRGNVNYEVERIINAVKSAIKSASIAIKNKCFIYGGLFLYSQICNFLNHKYNKVDYRSAIGYKVLERAFTNVAKNLIKNEGKNIEDEILRFERKEVQKNNVIDNYSVITNVITNASVMAINLLMVDDIIKAGKPLKDEKEQK